MLMMLPFEAPTIFEGIHKSYFRMPRVVRDQRGKFENDDLFRQLSHESAVKYTGFKDRPLEERQMKFIANCQEGHTEISVVQSGNQFTLMFNPTANPAYSNEGCEFDKDQNKVHIKSGFILNGVCVLWRGWLDLLRLEGFGCLEFDEYRAYLEDAMLKQQLDKQQTCSSNASAATVNHLHPHPPPPVPDPHQTISPLARLNHQSPHLAHQAHNVFSQMPPCQPPPPPSVQAQVGLGTSCLAQPPPVDPSAHYGNAAIAAAAAAAFHQALSVGAAGPPSPNSLRNQLPKLPTKRAAPDDDQTHLDDVDVVSDINTHELDSPPRRIFKSEPIGAVNHHHSHLHHMHQRATRRA